MTNAPFQMHPYDDALRIVEDAAWTLESETIPLAGAGGRVLAQDIVSDVAMPPFDKSAMDGYACRRGDVPGELTVVEHIAAGHAPQHVLGPGQCAKVMTGAPVPEGSECVVMVERSEVRPGDLVYLNAAPEAANIIPRAQDVAVGDTVLTRATHLYPAHLAVLASVGGVQPRVYVRPRVGIVSTGSEIVPPDQTPGTAQIRNSNGTQLHALCAAMGIAAKNYGVAEDTEAALYVALATASSECDVVLSTGGVSMGDFDLIPGTLEKLGLTLHLRRVAIQPGKPIAFGTGDSRAAFGLSGNPNSSYLQFELFVKPFLLRLQGTRHAPTEVLAPAAEAFVRSNGDRMLWLPATIDAAGRAVQVRYHGSAHIHAYTAAQGLLQIPVGQTEIAKGDPLRVRLFR